MLQALSLKIGTDFVIWQWRQDKVWERYILRGSPVGRKRSQKPPICLALRDGHYYRCLQRSDPEAAVPDAWLKETEDVVTIDLRGAGPGSVLSLSSKGSYKSQKRPSSQLSFDTDTNEESGDQEKHHQFGNTVPTRKKTSKCSKLSLPDNESGTCTLNAAKKHV